MEGVCVVQKESEGFSCVILRIDRDAMACPVCPQERSILLALGKGRAMTGMYESRGTVRASQLSCVRGVALWTDKKVQIRARTKKGKKKKKKVWAKASSTGTAERLFLHSNTARAV
ncbi:hypothetical protein MCOR02_002932 [Pyricularia oryzae]|uniref:Uncharacterized protein n=1 Tax=Pyricularia grisea TaxID=148305 RepID=A0ABQ8NWB7_PYRGI|nr:hypothetical protein MCOR01_008713 [Pyricularia oryzae]KAI6303098.1 hypothetical protein MCOR33_001695 [Pyricularia grisea]KAH9439373.1 hypothetical protein MCOR02_002932 [Pyricularia oryzae]KAI6255954.1 hypothetical protein MCOR19_007581 [Pyricularia oryzae]KAI6266358.1 hypothetical protein MCOR26_010232 [Pyricularia oryzae]